MQTPSESIPTPMEQVEEQLRVLAGLNGMLKSSAQVRTIIPIELIKEKYKMALDKISEIPLNETEKLNIHEKLRYYSKIWSELDKIKKDPVLTLLVQIGDSMRRLNSNQINDYNRRQLDKIEVADHANESIYNEKLNHYLDKLDWQVDVLARSTLRGLKNEGVKAPGGRLMGTATSMLLGKGPVEKVTIDFVKAREESFKPLLKVINTPIRPPNPGVNLKQRLSEVIPTSEEHRDPKVNYK